MTAGSTERARNAELWRQAEELHPRDVCTRCAAAVWRHWEERRDATQRRGLVDLCAGVKAGEVEAEYERLVAVEVAAVLDGPMSDETLFWLSPGSPLKFTAQQSFGLTGFQVRNAMITRLRYAPGSRNNDILGPIDEPRIHTWERGGFIDVPFVPGTAPLLGGGEVWGWERGAVRRFLAPKIVKPQPRVDVPFPVVVFDSDTLAKRSWDTSWGTAEPTPYVPTGWAPRPKPLVEGGTWGDVAKWLSEHTAPTKPLIEVAHELPPQLVGFQSGVVLYV